jgi:hypothetical protein
MTAATELYQISFGIHECKAREIPGDDYSLDIGVVLLDRLQNTPGTVDSRDKELIWIVGIHVEWRSGMGDTIDAFYSFVKCAFLYDYQRHVRKPY